MRICKHLCINILGNIWNQDKNDNLKLNLDETCKHLGIYFYNTYIYPKTFGKCLNIIILRHLWNQNKNEKIDENKYGYVTEANFGK